MFVHPSAFAHNSMPYKLSLCKIRSDVISLTEHEKCRLSVILTDQRSVVTTNSVEESFLLKERVPCRTNFSLPRYVSL